MALIKLNSRAIPDDTVVEADIADGSVTGVKLADNLNYDSGTLYLDSTNNRVGIGTNSPSSVLHILDTSTPQAKIAYDSTRYMNIEHATIYNVSGAGQSNNLKFATRGNSGNNNITFFTGGTDASGTGESEALRIADNGDVQFLNSGGNVRLYWDQSATGLVSSGAGISFDAGSNYLDDYEEGSFTPILTGEGACTITTSTALGQYNKVGRIVNVTIFFQVSSVSGGSSGLAVQVDGLPFTTNTNLNTTGAVRAQNLTNSASSLFLNIFNNATGGRIEEWNGANAGNLSDHIASNTNFAISITYSIT